MTHSQYDITVASSCIKDGNHLEFCLGLVFLRIMFIRTIIIIVVFFCLFWFGIRKPVFIPGIHRNWCNSCISITVTFKTDLPRLNSLRLADFAMKMYECCAIGNIKFNSASKLIYLLTFFGR